MKRVLLLDDDRELRALLRASLAVHGLEVVEASRVREAESLLQQANVDVAIVDGLLPDDQGLELIERLRARDRDVRIVYCSAYFRDMQTFERLTGTLGVSLVAYKPVDPKSFAEKIAELAWGRPVALASGAGERQDSGFALELARLTEQFADQLLARIDAIEEALGAAQVEPQHMARARDLAHVLRGSAGSYGFPAVSKALGVVEYLLAEASSRSAPGRPFFWEEVRAGLRDARREGAIALEALRRKEPPG